MMDLLQLIFLSAIPIFSWSALVFGSTATEITGSGNSIDSTINFLFISQIVSQVFVSFNHTIAPMFHAVISSTSSLLLACICSSLPILSLSQVVALYT
jgi:energy-converting hydrogenase Eha subunit E